MDPIATAHYGMMAASRRFGDEQPAPEAAGSRHLLREAAGGRPVADERLAEVSGRRRGVAATG